MKPPSKTAEYLRNRHKELSPEERRYRSRCGIARAYGLSLEEYDSRLVSQHNLCGACGLPFDTSKYTLRPVLDHSHTTGELRKFVHDGCNKAIGLLGEDAVRFRRIFGYLESFNAKVTSPVDGGLPEIGT